MMKSKLLIITLVAFFSIISFGMISADASHDDRESRGSDDPKITSVGDTAYVAWQESTDPDFWDVYFAKIINGTLQEPINLTNGTSFYPDVRIAVSGNNVYVLWEDRHSPEGDDAVFFTKSNDSGKTFDEPRMLAPKQGDSSLYRMMGMKTSGDSLYVFASNWNRETQQNRIVYYTSTDFGNTFSDAIMLFNHEQSDQGIQVEKFNETIYILADDRADYDEKGSLYLRKILPDGTLTDIVNVNDGNTTVTHPQFAVYDDNVYVSWRERVFEKSDNGVHERWYQAFTKSHDNGNTFDEPMLLESDPKSIDIVGAQGDFVFADEDSVYVFFRSEYWDGQNQTFKIHMAHSDNFGENFDVVEHPMNDFIQEYGGLMSFYVDRLYTMALTVKNPPQNDAAVYFASNSDSYHNPVEIFSGISVQSGMPDVSIDQNHIHFVTDTRSNHNCILYSHSDDYGKYFTSIVNISPNGNDFECLGVLPETTSPLQQLRQETPIQDIQCNQDISKGYILVLKAINQMPACVTADSYVKLKERGWILQDYDETIALHTARDFVESSPTFPFDGIKDTLKLDVLHTRKSIPAVVTITGEFQSSHPGYGDRSGQELSDETPVTHSMEIVITQNNLVHSAVLDESWNMITQDSVDKPKPENAKSVASSPTVSTTLSVAEPVDSRGLLPVTVTEKSENVDDSITFWQFQIMGHNADDRYEEWDILPKDKRVGWVFASEDGNTGVWDNSKIPSDRFAIPADLHGYTMFCEGQRIQGESAHPSGIPIKPEFDTIYAKSGSKAILPDSDGVYSVEFATLFETAVELPDSAEILENKTILCTMEEPREEATHGYYTKLSFKTNNYDLGRTSQPHPNTIDVSTTPYDGAILGDDHSHASILVKIFGDRFDFSHAQFQIKSPWIHFEAQDGSTIHRHAKHVTLGYLFDTLNIGLSPDCFVFPDGREFCNTDEYSLKFYINGETADNIRDYVISEGDRILISYGNESSDGIAQQLDELNLQAIQS